MTVTPTTAPTRERAKLIPVVEIFGPTVQGEGAEAGMPTHFVRVGGCDFRCSWCDTMYAVDPALVRANAEKLSSHDIVARVEALSGRPEWVAISGGNPALHDLRDVVAGLHSVGFRVSVETQGSRWASWLGDVDRLTISPKPPSSGMATAENLEQLKRFMANAMSVARASSIVKFVVFDDRDLEWAREIAARWHELPLYLSAGTPVPAADDIIRDAVGDAYRWLCETVAEMPELARARVLPQLHVIAWKGATGV
jgi:7-carboxy-7-deazaguanine synthase